jgi:hypothetical protein
MVEVAGVEFDAQTGLTLEGMQSWEDLFYPVIHQLIQERFGKSNDMA